KIGSSTMLSQIVQMVAQAQRSRAPMQRMADQVAGWFVIGDKVIGATLNTNGSLIMRSEKIGSSTMLSQIVQMVAQAQRSRAPMQRMADQVA
ncbi:hypothetical protein BUV99_13810, partial [Corynebacterium diphtheriae]